MVTRSLFVTYLRCCGPHILSPPLVRQLANVVFGRPSLAAPVAVGVAFEHRVMVMSIRPSPPVAVLLHCWRYAEALPPAAPDHLYKVLV